MSRFSWKPASLEGTEHAQHVCTKQCVDAHILGCDECAAGKDGVWFCREGAAINQRYLKAKHCGLLP